MTYLHKEAADSVTTVLSSSLLLSHEFHEHKAQVQASLFEANESGMEL